MGREKQTFPPSLPNSKFSSSSSSTSSSIFSRVPAEMDVGEWDLNLYAQIMEDVGSADLFLNDDPSIGLEIDASFGDVIAKDCGSRKRELDKPSVRKGSKACREKIRRDALNERFVELSSLLEPARPARTDKSAILSDAIRVLSQLKDEAKELKETNMKLEEERQFLKEEKHELREEISVIKAEKERMEKHVKSMLMTLAGFVPSHPTAYHLGHNKIESFPNYGAFPMWNWIPLAARDISKDHELRPPMA